MRGKRQERVGDDQRIREHGSPIPAADVLHVRRRGGSGGAVFVPRGAHARGCPCPLPAVEGRAARRLHRGRPAELPPVRDAGPGRRLRQLHHRDREQPAGPGREAVPPAGAGALPGRARGVPHRRGARARSVRPCRRPARGRGALRSGCRPHDAPELHGAGLGCHGGTALCARPGPGDLQPRGTPPARRDAAAGRARGDHPLRGALRPRVRLEGAGPHHVHLGHDRQAEGRAAGLGSGVPRHRGVERRPQQPRRGHVAGGVAVVPHRRFPGGRAQPAGAGSLHPLPPFRRQARAGRCGALARHPRVGGGQDAARPVERGRGGYAEGLSLHPAGRGGVEPAYA